jgi:hypothetical protein
VNVVPNRHIYFFTIKISVKNFMANGMIKYDETKTKRTEASETKLIKCQKPKMN